MDLNNLASHYLYLYPRTDFWPLQLGCYVHARLPFQSVLMPVKVTLPKFLGSIGEMASSTRFAVHLLYRVGHPVFWRKIHTRLATCSLNQFHVCANFMLLCSTVIFLVTEKGKTNTTFALENVYRWRGGGEDVDYYVRVERAISHKGGFEQNLTEYGRSSSQIETGDQNAVKENNHSVLTIILLLISLWCTNIRQWRWLLIITANRASFQIQFSCSKIITYLLHTDTDRPEC